MNWSTDDSFLGGVTFAEEVVSQDLREDQRWSIRESHYNILIIDHKNEEI